MIISRTPFRVSLAGGGSDLEDYYRQRPGNVVTTAINRYMYVTVNPRFDDSIRVSYTRTEIVDHVDELQHDLIRESMRMTGLTKGIEVTTIADLPAGIGLGSSSTLTVGVLNALYAMKGEWRSPADAGAPGVRHRDQDPAQAHRQAGPVHRGVRRAAGHPLSARRVGQRPPRHLQRGPAREARRPPAAVLHGRASRRGEVLSEARQRLRTSADSRAVVDGLVGMAGSVRQAIVSGRIDRVGGLLDESWRLKKQMASNVSNGHLDAVYEAARRAGAEGGKISGAGGGGCLLLCAPRARHGRGARGHGRGGPARGALRHRTRRYAHHSLQRRRTQHRASASPPDARLRKTA